MAKFVATPLASSYGSVAAINANLAAIEEAFQNTLSLDGSSPNAPTAPLDFNGQDVLNVGSIDVANAMVNGVTVTTYLDNAVGGLMTEAATSASTASAQATIAATQATNAANSAGDSANNAAAALLSETNAAASAAAAQAADKVGKTSSTGSAIIPTGTTAQRDGTPAAGYTRFNSDYNKTEVFNGSSWTGLGGANGNGGDAVFYENNQVVTSDYTIAANKNAMSAGPITVNTGATVTIESGAVWTIV